MASAISSKDGSVDSIFMIHGMWGGPGYWDRFRSIFEPLGYRCLATTLPYHDRAPGDAPDPRLGQTSVRDYADALEREITELGRRPILFGHSMGGLLAQILAARGCARAAVLLAPAPPAGITALTPSVLRSFLPVMMHWGCWRKPMRQPFATAVYSMLHLLPPEQQRLTYDRFVHESGRAACEIGLWPLDPHGATRIDAQAVDCPLLVIAGAEDRITPARVVRKVAQKYGAQATFKSFEHHAHWLVEEPGWEDVAHWIADWLNQLPPDAAPAFGTRMVR
ncbi:MAG: alpha/beta hydrolase [Rhodanobacter sp.]|nr:MAG: alpha/beta hydrolase [Rhodanobacter sp.]